MQHISVHMLMFIYQQQRQVIISMLFHAHILELLQSVA